MKQIQKRILLLALGAAIVALVVVAMRPSPPIVEVARANRGPLRVTVDEEGETRAHDRFVVAAPVAGRLERVELEDGDIVAGGQVAAIIHPLPLDVRSRAEAMARVDSAEAGKREAAAQVQHAQADYDQARRERERAEKLVKDGLISVQSSEQAKTAESTAAHELEAAKFRNVAAAYEVEVARAALIAAGLGPDDPARLVELRSPVRGSVLKVLEKSERVVPAGTPILSVGDAAKLEIVIDVLSTDAVKVSPGMPVLLENWGGERPLRACVRLVEPSGFTKISALGIEEQRVNVIADFVDPPGRLGDGYRVEARIIIWEAGNVLKIPSGALFRHGQDWNVFAIENGRAWARQVEIGHRSALEAEVLRGIEEGSEVIVHPSNEIASGMRVKTQ
jgi:HlyD family secretion protein